mgnify:CR=1 FL=1|tara:strand:- start:413 stop:610 length:198 start_codon:yes stop_codon:yes gene_type:complete
MTYCIELNMATVVFLVFILGFWLGCIFIRYLNKPKKPAKPIDYDGTNGKGYQPRPPVPLPEKPKK